ncbi:MAG TPA: SAM-dependent methyltransferase [Thermodesulfovibrionales bacterium]|nr:SAM-dependent methyltransferase [Thermodesulfovibrionales bacterium]
MNFEAFMDMALYYPSLGYYAKDSAKIGRTGDFYTSPHLHRIFGAMIGRQLEEMWVLMGRPDLFSVVEMGAGMGHLAKDLLEYLRGEGGKGQDTEGEKSLFEHLKYTIIEINPSLGERQRELLRDFVDKMTWLSHIGEIGAVRGCFLSNELLDAFPVRLVEMADDLMEIYVSAEGKSLVEKRVPCSSEVKEYFREFGVELPRGMRTEVNLRLRTWLKEVGEKLSDGFVLTIDYGYPAWDYYGDDRSRGTLLCYYEHQINEDPYQHVGEQDITAHVNFSSLKKWGDEFGLKTLGFCPQGTYLVSLGIDEVITEFYGSLPDPLEIAQIKGLIMPQGMGETHRVMVQYKGAGLPVLRGFRLRNQMGKL